MFLAGTTRSRAASAKTAPRRSCRTRRGLVSPIRCSWISVEPGDVDAAPVEPAPVSRRAMRAGRVLRMGPVQNAARVFRDSPRVSRDLRAAAGSDPGSHREVNEDRVHCDLSRGIFAVIDGVGGQAAAGGGAGMPLVWLRTRQ